MYYNCFYGWYFKCQSETQTLAVIPAVHNAKNTRTCSVQVITDHDAWAVTLSADSFKRTRGNIFIGENRFGEKGIRLAIHTPQLTVSGNLAALGRGPGAIISQRVYLDAMLLCGWGLNAVSGGYSHGRHSLYRYNGRCFMAGKRV